MASAEFLKKLGLKPHVPTTPPVSQPDVLEKPVAGAAPVRPADSAATAQGKSPAAPAKPAGLSFKIGGKPIAAPPVAKESVGDSGAEAVATNVPRPTVEDGRVDAGSTEPVPTAPAGRKAESQPEELPAPNADHPGAVSLNIEPTTDSFQTLLDQFDAMVGQVGQITQLELDQSRNFVARIMKDLVTHPEFDGLVIDRDVHNIMKFVQASSGMANKNFVTSQERKMKSAQKKAEAAAINLDVFDFGSDVASQMAALKAKKGIAPSKPLTITNLASLSTDDIETKNRR